MTWPESTTTTPDPTAIHGFTAPGFEIVRDAFAANFTVRDELGAAFAAYVDGEVTVDLWGGWADPGRTRVWEADTLEVIFSGTKGLVAIAVMLLVDRGLLDLNAPVAFYWPEFGANGKDSITVADALSHRAGLPGVPAGLSIEELLDDRAMAARLASQRPLWDDRNRVSYHSLTHGWIAGEIIRRITDRSVGNFFDEEIARPLELDAWIGLPAGLEPRMGTLQAQPSFREKWRDIACTEAGRILLGGLPLFADPLVWNRSDYHAAEFPSANGVATARSMARLYGVLACGGVSGGQTFVGETSVIACTAERTRGVDALTGDHLVFASGFQLQNTYATFGPNVTAFGHSGAGGSVHGCWADRRTGFSYVMNSLSDELADDRARVLLATLFSAVANRTR